MYIKKEPQSSKKKKQQNSQTLLIFRRLNFLNFVPRYIHGFACTNAPLFSLPDGKYWKSFVVRINKNLAGKRFRFRWETVVETARARPSPLPPPLETDIPRPGIVETCRSGWMELGKVDSLALKVDRNYVNYFARTSCGGPKWIAAFARRRRVAVLS
mgnify:CR=1 FL=1